VASFDEVIPPGQVGHVTAKLDTVKLRGEVGRGVTVRTDDPARPNLFLTVRATVVGGVTILPEEMLHLHNRDSRPARAAVVVTRDASESGELAIADVRPSVPWLAAATERVGEPRPAAEGLPATGPGDWVLRVEPRDGAPYGRHRAELTFSTGLVRQRQVVLPVMIVLEPPVRLSTERLGLPAGAGAASPRQTVLLTVRPGLDPSSLRIDAPADSFDVELEPSGARAFKLHVAWVGSGEPRGEIRFLVGSESYALPVYSKSGSS